MIFQPTVILLKNLNLAFLFAEELLKFSIALTGKGRKGCIVK